MKTNTRIYIAVLLATFTFLFVSCTKAVIDEVSPSDLSPINGSVTYNANVKSLMFNSCVTCHGGSTPSAGLDLTSYANVRQSAEHGTLKQRINSATNPMPQSGLLPASQRQLIEKWINDGFPEN